MQTRLTNRLDICCGLLDRTGTFSYRNAAPMEPPTVKHETLQRLEDLPPELMREELTRIAKSASYHLSLDALRPHVQPMREQIDTESVFTVYFYDEMILLALRKEEESHHLTAGPLYLDDYEEAMESVGEVRHPLLTVMVDREIVRHSNGMQAIMKKLEEDRYFLAIECHYLQEFLDSQLDILEQVKTVNVGNEIRITLSIGIGDDDSSYAQCYGFTRQIIDTAPGRDGDQATVKGGENTRYFGGKLNPKEETICVKARTKVHASHELIENRDRPLIMGHKLTDTNSFGAVAGIWRIAMTMGKEIHIVSPVINGAICPMFEHFYNGDYPEDMFIPEEKTLQLLGEGFILVVVGTNRPSMAEGPRFLDVAKTIAVLGHHRRSQGSIRNVQLSYTKTYVSSTCETVAEVMQYIPDDVKTQAVEADTMYAGIVVDTHNFQNQIGVRTFEAVASLRQNGADVTRVRKLFHEKLDDHRAENEAIHNVEIYRGSLVLSYCDVTGLDNPTVIGVQTVNDLPDVIGVKTSVVATTFREKVYSSAHAVGEVNVRVMMEKLGGSGHRTIAGTQLSGLTQEEAMEQAKQVIDGMLLKREIS